MPSQLMSLKDEVIEAHEQCCRDGRSAINHALRCGELLTLLKPIVKENPATPSFGGWVDQYLPFSHRTAQRYMKLHNELSQLKKATRLSLLEKAPSVDGVVKMLPDFKVPKPPEPPEPPWDPNESESPGKPGGSPTGSEEPEQPNPAQQAKSNAKVAKDLIDRAVRAVDDLHAVKPNRPMRDRIVAALQKCGKAVWK